MPAPAPAPKEKWRKSKAKELLKVEVLVGRLTLKTDLRALHQSKEEFSKWPWSRFSQNTKNLIKSLNDPAKRKKIKWAGSKGRQLLKDAIISGTVTELSDPEEVHNSNDPHKVFPLANFKTNMKNLLEAIISDFGRLEMDSLACEHDMAIIREMRANNPLERRPWHRSPCKALLEKDIDELKHLEIIHPPNKPARLITPKELYESRIEYREFSLTVFRKHIYQEIDRRSKRDNRVEKKKSRARCKPPADIDFQIVANAPRRMSQE